MKLVRSGLRLWLLAFTGFFLLHAAWAFAAPYDGPPDEESHTLHAAAVAHGELVPYTDMKQHVPKSLVRPHCFEMNVDVAAGCVAEPGGDSTTVSKSVSAANYNPVYYLVAAWPVAVWPSWKGILLARLFTGAAIAALLASAVVAATRWSRHRAVLAGLVVGISPMAASLGGAINPNGVEIAAGVALWAGLIPLLQQPRDRVNRAMVALVGVSSCVLVTPRALGIMWLGLIFLTCLIGTRRARLRQLVRDRAVRWWLAAIAVSTAAALAWTFVARPVRVPAADNGMTAKEILRFAVLDMWPNVANQMVGVTGWSEVLQPRLIYVAWFMAAGLLVLGGFALGGRADRLRILTLFAGTFIPLLGEELLLANKMGWFNQGRYFLAGAVGLPMLGAHVLAKRGLTPVNLRSVTRILAVLLVPIHFVVLAYTMCRWQSGLRILDPLKGSWLPPHGPVLPLALGAASVVVLLVLYWRASRVPVEAAGLENQPEAGESEDGTSQAGPEDGTSEDGASENGASENGALGRPARARHQELVHTR